MGLQPMIQQMDPPRHDSLRNLLWKAFTPRVSRREPSRSAQGSAISDLTALCWRLVLAALDCPLDRSL
jgi:hypothetical protein